MVDTGYRNVSVAMVEEPPPVGNTMVGPKGAVPVVVRVSRQSCVF